MEVENRLHPVSVLTHSVSEYSRSDSLRKKLKILNDLSIPYPFTESFNVSFYSLNMPGSGDEEINKITAQPLPIECIYSENEIGTHQNNFI